MALPKPLSVQTINGLKSDAFVYEAHKQTIHAFNQLIGSLAPGTSTKPENFSLSAGLGTGAAITALTGTFKRGSFTVTIGSGPAANPYVAMNFPANLFSDVPFSLVARNGGTGNLSFTFASTVNQLKITFAGTPTAGHVYTLNYSVQE